VRESSVKEWHDLENWVKGCSKSLKMMPFDRTYTIFYCSPTITIALSSTMFELFGIEQFVTLKSGLQVTEGH